MKYEIDLKNKLERIDGTEQPLFSFVSDLLSKEEGSLPETLAKLKEYVYALASGSSSLADVYVSRAFAETVCGITYPHLKIQYIGEADSSFAGFMNTIDASRFVGEYENDTEAIFSIVDFMLEQRVNWGICLNCGRLFNPYRRDLRYCERPIPDHAGRRCIDIGAKLNHYSRTINDPTLKRAKNIGARLCNRARRNPENLELLMTYENFVKQRGEWQKAVKNGERTMSDYALWLDKVDEEISLKKVR